MIGVGAVCVCKQTGNIAWVVDKRMPDGRWRVISKAVDGKGRQKFSARIAGEGDLTLITEAPVFAPGTVVTVNGGDATVLEDKGDIVLVAIPETRYPHRAGVVLAVPASQADAAKSDLVLEVLT